MIPPVCGTNRADLGCDTAGFYLNLDEAVTKGTMSLEMRDSRRSTAWAIFVGRKGEVSNEMLTQLSLSQNSDL